VSPQTLTLTSRTNDLTHERRHQYEEENRGAHGRPVLAIRERLGNVAHAVDRFEDDPAPDPTECARPLAAHHKEEAPQPKEYEADVCDEEPDMRIRRENQRGQELRRGKHFLQPPEVPLGRMSHL